MRSLRSFQSPAMIRRRPVTRPWLQRRQRWLRSRLHRPRSSSIFPSILLCTMVIAAYGNIGSGNRLDFTAVGRDINILSRLELVCKDVGRPLLMTGAFAAEVAAPVVEIGHFELRGFRQHQSLYGLCQDGEAPAAPTGADGVEQAERPVGGNILLLRANGHAEAVHR